MIDATTIIRSVLGYHSTVVLKVGAVELAIGIYTYQIALEGCSNNVEIFQVFFTIAINVLRFIFVLNFTFFFGFEDTIALLYILLSWCNLRTSVLN